MQSYSQSVKSLATGHLRLRKHLCRRTSSYYKICWYLLMVINSEVPIDERRLVCTTTSTILNICVHIQRTISSRLGQHQG